MSEYEPSIFAGLREDLAPKAKKPRKRQAYNFRGRPKSSNIEDRRTEPAATAESVFTNLGLTTEPPPIPAPRNVRVPKGAPKPKKRPRRDDDEGDHEYR